MPADRPPIDVDREIERAVQGMLDVEAPVWLRGRVEARLRAGGDVAARPSEDRTRRWLWWAPAASAAIIVLAVLLWPALGSRPVVPGPPPPRPAMPDVAQRTPSEPASPLVEGPSASREARPAAARRGHAAQRPATTTDAAIEAAAITVEIDPIPRPAPIEITPIAGTRVTPTDIEIAALPEIAPIAVKPLSPDGER